jgi:putative transposase
LNVFVNNILEQRDENGQLTERERVLWISSENNAIIVISMLTKNPLPRAKNLDEIQRGLKEGRYIKLDYDPYSVYMVQDNVLSTKEIELRDSAWSCIKDIVEIEPNIYDPKERYEMIKDICQKTSKGKGLLYKYLRNFWLGGKNENALIPRYRNSGGRGKKKNPEKKMGRPRRTIEVNHEYSGVKVTEGTRKIFDAAISRFYNNRRRNSVKFAYVRMLSEFYSIETKNENGVEIPIIPPEYKVPSLPQFRYYLRTKFNQRQKLVAREGEVTFSKDFRPLLGSETQRARGPGQIFQVDATVADVYLISSDDPNDIIGRPVVYMVIDVWSHMVVGIYVGFEGPSWLGLMMAIENTAANKVEFCAEYGISIQEDEWPCHHMPQSFFADRGEMESKNADSLAKALGIKIKNAPPYRADMKGIIEQRFRILNITLQPWMPGGVKKEYQQRGGPDYVLDAKLTIKDFTKMLIEMVLNHNNSRYMEHYPLDKALAKDNVLPVPRNLWEWGVFHDHYLKEIPLDVVRLNVLPEHAVTANREGIYFQGMYYGSDELLQQGWFIRGKSIKTAIAYDRRCMNHVYVKTDNGRSFIKCRLLDKSARFRDLTLEEIKQIQHEEKIERSLYLSTELQAEVGLHAKLDAIAEEAIKKKEQALDPDLTKTERKANIKQNKKVERERLRKEQYFELSKETIDKQLQPEIEQEEEQEIYSPNSKLGFLAQLNEERKLNG